LVFKRVNSIASRLRHVFQRVSRKGGLFGFSASPAKKTIRIFLASVSWYIRGSLVAISIGNPISAVFLQISDAVFCAIRSRICIAVYQQLLNYINCNKYHPTGISAEKFSSCNNFLGGMMWKSRPIGRADSGGISNFWEFNQKIDAARQENAL